MKHLYLGAIAAALMLPGIARADFRVISPREIDYGEIEIEHNGSSIFDRRDGRSGGQSHTIEIGTGITRWWKSELELAFEKEPGRDQPMLATQIVTENVFQLTEPGEHFVDLGFYFEYGQSLLRGRYAGSNQATFGPLFAKDIGRTTTTVNFLFTRQLGPSQTTQGLNFNYALQTKWNLWGPLSPAIEVYGDAGTIGSSPKFTEQQLMVGPVAVGRLPLNELGLGRAGKIKYEVGWLFGTTRGSPEGALRWRLEFEFPF